MKSGFVHWSKRESVYYGLKRQTVIEYQSALKQATGWRKYWIRWKRGVSLEIRYNQLLFAQKHPFPSLT